MRVSDEERGEDSGAGYGGWTWRKESKKVTRRDTVPAEIWRWVSSELFPGRRSETIVNASGLDQPDRAPLSREEPISS
jgi:hypothetical protein